MPHDAICWGGVLPHQELRLDCELEPHGSVNSYLPGVRGVEIVRLKALHYDLHCLVKENEMFPLKGII